MRVDRMEVEMSEYRVIVRDTEGQLNESVRVKLIDPKYGMIIGPDGEPMIVKAATLEPIPDDEPLILFRGRDHNAIEALRRYEDVCKAEGCTDFHMDGINNRMCAFLNFKVQHPERMKQPGITRGL